MNGATLAVKADTRMSPITLKVLDVLSDGEWHDQEDVIEAAMYVTPPGEAFRHGQSRSKALVDRRSQEEIIASGQRSKAVDSINSLITNDRVEREGVDPRNNNAPGKRVRLKADVAPQVYVARTKDGELTVHSTRPNQVLVYVIDAMSDPVDAEEELKITKGIYDTIPARISGRDRLLAACRSVLNDLGVRSAFQRIDREFGEQDFEATGSSQ